MACSSLLVLQIYDVFFFFLTTILFLESKLNFKNGRNPPAGEKGADADLASLLLGGR